MKHFCNNSLTIKDMENEILAILQWIKNKWNRLVKFQDQSQRKGQMASFQGLIKINKYIYESLHLLDYLFSEQS